MCDQDFSIRKRILNEYTLRYYIRIYRTHTDRNHLPVLLWSISLDFSSLVRLVLINLNVDMECTCTSSVVFGKNRTSTPPVLLLQIKGTPDFVSGQNGWSSLYEPNLSVSMSFQRDF